MDINMPGINGVTTTSYIRDYLKDNKASTFPHIVAHTAIPSDQFGDYKQQGFDDFLGKPVSI
jgi:CheY-like chemotaxis protein